MCIKMPKNIKEERFRWIFPIVNKEVGMADTAKICPHSAQSQEVAQGISKIWNNRLEPKSTRPKTNPKETPIRIKERIIELRKITNNIINIQPKIHLPYEKNPSYLFLKNYKKSS